MKERAKITVEVAVNASIEDAWKAFTDEKSVIHWNHASDDWCCPRAKNDLRVGGEFAYRMEAKDGSFGFDFGGTYTEIEENRTIKYELGDERRVEVLFEEKDKRTKVIETFDAEGENTLELQKNGWQAILDNFKRYAENNVSRIEYKD